MTRGKAESRARLWGVACFVLGIGATVLALLGTYWWLVAVALALVTLVVTFHYEKTGQWKTRHRWNRHKFWNLLGISGLIVGVVGLVVTLAFWAIRDSAGFDSFTFTFDGTGVSPAFFANLGLVIAGLVAVIRVDSSKLDIPG